MIATTANFQAAAALKPSKPVFRFSVAGYSKVFVWRKTGRTGELAWITAMGDWGVSVDPMQGSYSIDDLVVTVLDIGAGVTSDLSMFLLEQRFCTLQMGFDGLALSDYCTLFQGIVDTVTNNPDGTYSFTCNDYNRLNQKVIYVYGDDGTVTTTTTTYSGSNPYAIVTETFTTDPVTSVVTPAAVVTYSGSGPSGPARTVVSGTTTTVITSRVVMVGGSNTTVYESVATTIGSNVTTVVTTTYGGQLLYANVAITTQTQQSTGLATTSVDITYTENGAVGVSTVSDNALITSTNPKHLIGHPLDMLLDILQVEVGLADSDINIAQIQSYRDTVWSGTEFEFFITGSVDAKDFMENQLLKPLGGYLYPNYLGQVCVGFAQPLVGSIASVASMDPTNLSELPTLSVHDLINVLTMRFDKDDFSISTASNSTGYLAQSNTFYAPSIVDLPDLSVAVATELVSGSGAVQGQLIIESDGMRSGFQGFLLSQMIASSIFRMYGSYNPTLEVTAFWEPTFATELGEYVYLTHPLLPNRKTGTIGITNQLFKVIKRSYNFLSMLVTFTLEDASGVALFQAKRIRPAGVVSVSSGSPPAVVITNYPQQLYSASTAYEKNRYVYMSDINSNQADGDAAARLG
jgi:hypothetical protein